MKDAPGKLYRRTSKAAADSIVRTGVVPGGVGATESVRRVTSLSTPLRVPPTTPGFAPPCPSSWWSISNTQLSRVLSFSSESDVVLTSDIVRNYAILYYTDAPTGEVLWRNALRLEASDEAFQTDKQSNEDTAASSTRPGQPQADSSAIRFKTFAMPISYTDCVACGEDMMH